MYLVVINIFKFTYLFSMSIPTQKTSHFVLKIKNTLKLKCHFVKIEFIHS